MLSLALSWLLTLPAIKGSQQQRAQQNYHIVFLGLTLVRLTQCPTTKH